MLETLALTLIVLTALYLCALAAASLIVPAKANHFLRGFASSARVHYVELSARLLVGAALLVYAPHMFASGVFTLFGWVLVLTTVCLLLLPWRWHRRFAQQAVTWAIAYIKVIGVFSLVLGGLMLAAVIRGNDV